MECVGGDSGEAREASFLHLHRNNGGAGFLAERLRGNNDVSSWGEQQVTRHLSARLISPRGSAAGDGTDGDLDILAGTAVTCVESDPIRGSTPQQWCDESVHKFCR